jgi:hypothetical protein
LWHELARVRGTISYVIPQDALSAIGEDCSDGNYGRRKQAREREEEADRAS